MFKPIKEQYKEDVVPALMTEFGYTNINQVPKIEKVVINVGLGEALDNSKAVDAAVNDIQQITGQKPVLNKARKSIAGFKLREGRVIGIKVTLRSVKMWSFLQRLIHLALPRTRDFQGVSADSFDGRGNYTLGLPEQLIFPEIDYDKIDKIRGLSVSVVTSANTDEEARRLLALLNMPFKKD
ncbi:MAG: 50S ribosomal protein L5 [Chloroflexota bacterium]